jgi:hypothetical protein
MTVRETLALRKNVLRGQYERAAVKRFQKCAPRGKY